MELCRLCLFYDPIKKTCSKTVTAISRGVTYYGNAKAARDDPKQCGPSGRLFVARPTPFLSVENLSKLD